jgi:hypothetical protein
VKDEVVQLPPLTPPDKKSLKSLQFAHRKERFDSLGKASTPEDVLHLSLLLIFQQLQKEPLDVPAHATSLAELTAQLTTGPHSKSAAVCMCFCTAAADSLGPSLVFFAGSKAMPEEIGKTFQSFHAKLPSSEGMEEIREFGMKKDISK